MTDIFNEDQRIAIRDSINTEIRTTYGCNQATTAHVSFIRSNVIKIYYIDTDGDECSIYLKASRHGSGRSIYYKLHVINHYWHIIGRDIKVEPNINMICFNKPSQVGLMLWNRIELYDPFKENLMNNICHDISIICVEREHMC